MLSDQTNQQLSPAIVISKNHQRKTNKLRVVVLLLLLILVLIATYISLRSQGFRINISFGTKQPSAMEQQLSDGLPPQPVTLSDPILDSVSDSAADYSHEYIAIPVTVIISTNTQNGTISDQEITDIKQAFELARQFYFRNTGLKINLVPSYEIISTRLEMPDRDPDANACYTIPQIVLPELTTSPQAALIVHLSPDNCGSWASYAMLGDDQSVPFSHIDFPPDRVLRFPYTESRSVQNTTWKILHELQHGIDYLYSLSGHAEMGHGDYPSEFGEMEGDELDYEAGILRRFQTYLDLSTPFTQKSSFIDNDEDGLPDDDATLPIDEQRFSSSSQNSDSDNDGLSDKAEYMAGIFNGSDPSEPDTDADGIKDSDDTWPLNPISTRIGPGDTLTNIASGVYWTTIDVNASLAASCQEDSYTLVIDTDQSAVLHVQLDANGDGWWHGKDNLDLYWDSRKSAPQGLRVMDNTAGSSSSYHEGSWDMGAVAIADLKTELIRKDEGVTFRITFPSLPSQGISFAAGSTPRFSIFLIDIDQQGGTWASYVEPYRFITTELVD
jgi:hypothetical protein